MDKKAGKSVGANRGFEVKGWVPGDYRKVKEKEWIQVGKSVGGNRKYKVKVGCVVIT